MIRLQENLYLPYEELSRFLERLPEGMTYDLLQSKIPSLRSLKKKELDILLKYVIEKNRIVVTEITQKGVKCAPLLRHKMFTAPINVLAQPEKERPSGSVVHITGAGKQTIVTKKRSRLERIIPPIKEEKEMATQEKPVTTKTVVDFESLRAEHLVDVKLINAADKIKAFLLTDPKGFTRTEIDESVKEYRYLKGAPRQQVLSYLKAYEGVVEKEWQPEKYKYPVGRFVHPDFINAETAVLPEAVKDYTFANKEEAKPQVKVNESAIRGMIVELLKASKSLLPIYQVWNYLPNLPELSKEARFAILNPLVEKGIVSIYSDDHPNKPGCHVNWIKLNEEGDTVGIVHRTKTEAPTAMAVAVMEALQKGAKEGEPTVETNASKYPNRLAHLEARPVNLATLPEMANSVPNPITPIEFKEQTMAPATSTDVRKQILELERVAIELEQKERNEALIAAIKPLRDEIVMRFAEAQKAIDAQIDAQAALGLAIEKLNQAIGQ
ncbi:hypothetical protein MOA67_gp208 [Klebsiella phage KpLz-2_45]|uniref:hypothetical protein n=1 Tax=Klebsiella phage KpLz-2_45 TaxID=2698923 RepID=UPI001F12B9D4|nr:hypothetical protein MOA67_gp208 [Klebsiella phage KpLz-2_45]UKS72215.1 hypothetical protein KpLz245_3490 [Klebsiella phage KpLz-2_45]